jgi:hypothetical protein
MQLLSVDAAEATLSLPSSPSERMSVSGRLGLCGRAFQSTL